MTQTVDKIIFVGNEGVGKTSLLSALKKYPFDSAYNPTERVDVTDIVLDETKIVNVFDCSGKAKNLLFAHEDWNDASIALIFFDLSNLSWRTVFDWVYNVTSLLGDDIPLIIVGTKSDLISTYDKGLIARGLFALRRKHKHVRYVETSAKKEQNCDQVLSILKNFL